MLARTLAAVALACATVATGAQTPTPPRQDRPGAPAYKSAFEGYRPYAEEPLAPWREVNETVERVGGHVGVLRAEEQHAPPRPAAAPARDAKEQGHDAHQRK
jgi:hypothetical protein